MNQLIRSSEQFQTFTAETNDTLVFILLTAAHAYPYMHVRYAYTYLLHADSILVTS